MPQLKASTVKPEEACNGSVNATDTRATIDKLLEAVFSTWSDQRLYKEGKEGTCSGIGG
jgi:hypothetical protein